MQTRETLGVSRCARGGLNRSPPWKTCRHVVDRGYRPHSWSSPPEAVFGIRAASGGNESHAGPIVTIPIPFSLFITVTIVVPLLAKVVRMTPPLFLQELPRLPSRPYSYYANILINVGRSLDSMGSGMPDRLALGNCQFVNFNVLSTKSE